MGNEKGELGVQKGPTAARIDVDDGVRDLNTHSDIFFAAVSTTRMPMIVADPNLPDCPIIFANPAFMQMTGYSKEELVGHNCRLLQGPDTDQATIRELRDAVENRREIAVEILNYKKNGASFWNALFMSPVFDTNGRLIYFFGSQLDVSRRRDAEDGLRQAQKMEAVGQLTGGVAHDFNNLLTVIQGFTDILQADQEKAGVIEGRKAKRALDAIQQAAERGSALTQQLLAFSRKQTLQGRVVDLNELVDNISPILRRALGPDHSLDVQLGDPGCNARIDTTQAELALLNIVINARDAMPGGGRIVIGTGTVRVTEDDVDSSQVNPGDYAAVHVTDTGDGMSNDVMARATEPFFTTKEQGRGTGLGLSMVYGFVKQSGGALRIQSQAGDGTTMRLLFPCVRSEAEPLGAQPPRPMSRERGTETVLVVEDQVEVGDYATSVLEDFGYRVLRAENGPSALDIIKGDAEIDLLFTDLMMPGGMNGVVLAREARRHRPRLKILLTTGYADNTIDRVDGDGKAFDQIDKPYRRRDLIKLVRRTLDGPTGVG